MLFRKRIPRSCSYCARGTALDADHILCVKKGTVSALYACKKFRYDPCKRVPHKMKPLDMDKYTDADFTLL